MVGPAYMDYAPNGRAAGPKGKRHPLNLMAPDGVVRFAGDDRWISIAVENEAEWAAMVDAMGDPDWAGSPDFASLQGRLENIEVLHEQIERFTAEHDDRELSERLQTAGVAAAPVLNVGDLLHDPHYKARGTFIEVDHPLGFSETIYGSYVKLSQHVFTNILGMSPEKYDDLVERKMTY